MLADHAQLHKEAQRHLAQGRAQRAAEVYRQLLANASVMTLDYNTWLKGAAQAYRSLRRDREAGFICLCLGDLARARELFPRDGEPLDAARVRELEARAIEPQGRERAAPLFREAGDLYAQARRHVLSAIAYGEAGELAQARAEWQRVLQDRRLRPRSYEQGLVHFNLGLLSRRAGDKAEARHHVIQAQQVLEELADDLEGRGERERAFDCYGVLLKLGQELGSFENLAEGYSNCIRVLKEDNLKFYVVQYYEDFLRQCLERQEYHAAALLLREAADYTRRVGLDWYRAYLRRGGETWWKAVEKNEAQGGPVKLSENAYLASIDCWCALGDFPRVRETYRRLGELALPEKKRQRYRGLLARYSDAAGEPAEEGKPFPEYLRNAYAYPEIWHMDMIEWEYDGDPEAVSASLVGDAKCADMVRRRALAVLLALLDERAGGAAPALGGDARARVLGQVAQGLGDLKTYASLRPLERLYEDPDPRVRRAVIAALRHLCYKRTFQLVVRGLRDEDAGVRGEALEVLRTLHFPHAVDPLIRIFREHEDGAVKKAALEALGRVGDLCAGEFLIDVLRHEEEPLCGVAQALLVQYGNPDIVPILRRYQELESGRTRAMLEKVLRGA